MKYSEEQAENIIKEWSAAWHEMTVLRMDAEKSQDKFREILVRYIESAIEEGKKRK